jgi:hypothetical protein
MADHADLHILSELGCSLLLALQLVGLLSDAGDG